MLRANCPRRDTIHFLGAMEGGRGGDHRVPPSQEARPNQTQLQGHHPALPSPLTVTSTMARGAGITGGIAISIQEASMRGPRGVGGRFLVSSWKILPLGPGQEEGTQGIEHQLCVRTQVIPGLGLTQGLAGISCLCQGSRLQNRSGFILSGPRE